MSDVKISGLPVDASPTTNDYAVSLDSDTTTLKRTLWSTLISLFFANNNIPAGFSPITRGSETSFNFVASGCIVTADAPGSTRNASMTSGVVYIAGTRLTVALVSSRSYTASDDTYIDLKDNGDGTASINYTAVANNSASPALFGSGTTSNTVRVGIVVAGATTIANAASINQGQETMVLPIASSIAYSVTDSLGNLICPRDPNRRILGYRQIITNTSVTTPTVATVVVGLTVPVIIPTGRKVKVTVSSFLSNTGANDSTMGACLTSAADANRISQGNGNGGVMVNGSSVAVAVPRTDAGSQTYVAYARAATGSVTYNSSSTNPNYIMVELV